MILSMSAMLSTRLANMERLQIQEDNPRALANHFSSSGIRSLGANRT